MGARERRQFRDAKPTPRARPPPFSSPAALARKRAEYASLVPAHYARAIAPGAPLDDAAALRDLGIPIGEGSTLRGFDLLPYQFSNLPSGVGFCVASAAATGLPSASVDVVYVSNALYNHGELRPMAAETARILRPGERQRMLNRPCVAALATGSAIAATTLGTNHAALLPHTD